MGDLFCFADRQLLVCSLSKEAKMVPRRIGLPGKPQKMAFSTILQALIVSYNISSVEDPENPLTKTVKSFIEFVDPDSQSSVIHNDSNPPCWRPESARGETVSCILDWTFERDGKTYYMVAIGTSMPVLYHNDPQQGRLILLAPRRDPSEPSKITCVTQFTRIMQGSIHALAAYEDSLIIGAGNFLIPMASKAASTTWHKTAPTELPSTVVSISIHGNFIFTLTARHSWLVFEIVNQPALNESSVMLARRWDRIERDGLTHLISHDDNPVLFMSHRGGRVCATTLDETHWSRDTVNKIKYPNTFAEAKLHESVLRFVPGNKLDNSLFGFTILGSIYRFVLPNADELKLLRFLQNICYKVDAICPSAPKQLRRKKPHDLTAHHIDGDILTRLSHRGPDFLENIITSLDSNSARELFNRLALQAVGHLSVEAVISWLRKMLDITI